LFIEELFGGVGSPAMVTPMLRAAVFGGPGVLLGFGSKVMGCAHPTGREAFRFLEGSEMLLGFGSKVMGCAHPTGREAFRFLEAK
jgi:hypothetical protein